MEGGGGAAEMDSLRVW